MTDIPPPPPETPVILILLAALGARAKYERPQLMEQLEYHLLYRIHPT